MTNIIRRRVSQNRKRLVEGHYDLDLTYICENIIAMGYPSDKPIQSLIRNRIDEVSKFLNERHSNSYKVFNLCQESDYNFMFFNNMVEKIELEDHNPPTFSQILYFCSKVDEWIKEKENNVVVIHCKAGKGRTGTMICNYFLYTKKFESPFDAMDEFSRQRCKDSKGVTIPSQRRYIEYFYDYIKNDRTYTSIELTLNHLKISQARPSFSKISFQIMNREGLIKIYDSKFLQKEGETDLVFETDDKINLKDDIKFSFLNKAKECVFSVSFNTFCLIMQEEGKYSTEPSCLGSKLNKGKSIVFRVCKREIDIINKNSKVNENFEIEFVFELKSVVDQNKLQEKPQAATVIPVNEKFTFEAEDLKKSESVQLQNNTIESTIKIPSKLKFLSFLTKKFKLKRSVSETYLHVDTKIKTNSEAIEAFSKSNTFLNE